MERTSSPKRRISLEEMPFALLSASEALLVPLLGQAAGAADYLHEFAHDGRHLLAVPCH